MKVVDKGDDAAIVKTDPDPQAGLERLPQRFGGKALDQFAAHPALHLDDFLDHFTDWSPPGGFAVEWRHTTELAIEMAASSRKAALPGHVGIRTQQFHPWTLVVFQ